MSEMLHVGYDLKKICFAGVLGRAEHRIPLAPVCPPRPHGFAVRRSEFGRKSHRVGAFGTFAFVVCIVFYPTLLLRQSTQGRTEEIIISLEVYIVDKLRSCLYYSFGIVVFVNLSELLSIPRTKLRFFELTH
jgi:hypothetical protein